MVTVTENQHVQNQHIIPPVSLQLATTTQTYSLCFQPLAKFGFYHLLTQPSTDSHSESATPPTPKHVCPSRVSLVCHFLFMLTDGYLNQCYFLVEFCNTESHFSDLLDFILIPSQFIYCSFMFQGYFFRKSFIISLDYSLLF